MKSRSWFAVCSSVVALSLAFAVGCDERRAPERSIAAASTSPEVRWASGKENVYAFTLRSEAKLASAPTGALDVRGRLTVLPLEPGAGGQWFVIGLSAVSFKAPQNSPNADYTALSAELGSAVGAFRFEDGALAEQWVHQNASPVGANLVRTLIAALQSSAGKAREVDSTGIYESKLAPEPGGFSKQKLAYQHLNAAGVVRGQAASAPLPTLDGAVFHYRVDAGHIAGVKGRELVHSDMGGQNGSSRPVLEATNELSLELTNEPAVTLPTLDQVKQLTRPWGREEAFVGPSDDRRLDEARRAAFTYDAALAKLVELLRETKGDFSSGRDGEQLDEATRSLRKEQLELYQKAFESLSAHLRASPELVKGALVTIRRGPSEERALLVDALGSAGSKDAQRALLALATTENEDLRLRGSAFSRLARADEPIEEVVPALLEISHHPKLAEYGLLGLGTLARRLRESGATQRADAIDELLGKELASASDPARQRRVLIAMSNSGAASNVERAKPFLKAEDHGLASAAVASVRLVPGTQADQILIGALEHPERSVRRQALDAMKGRAPSQAFVSAVGHLARDVHDVSDQVRAVRVLGSWRSGSPEAAQLLASLAQGQGLAQGEGSEKVQGAARAELGG